MNDPGFPQTKAAREGTVVKHDAGSCPLARSQIPFPIEFSRNDVLGMEQWECGERLFNGRFRGRVAIHATAKLGVLQIGSFDQPDRRLPSGADVNRIAFERLALVESCRQRDGGADA